ncbi:hypothetical protein ACSNOI_32985 [Actinomadura kijaniata]|uniref:hypothetical protein n=1 Tax=Actinomadura kijaniata TaxID=46161 RepID=UPI003F1AA0D1
MNVNKKIALGAAATGLLGMGLYLTVPAAASGPAAEFTPAAAPRDGGQRWHHRGGLGLHGEATVRNRDGAFTLRTWQRGQITARSAATVSVKSEDGVTWQWTTNDRTRFGKRGERSSLAAFAVGDRVVVTGDRSGDTRTAAVLRSPRRR